MKKVLKKQLQLLLGIIVSVGGTALVLKGLLELPPGLEWWGYFLIGIILLSIASPLLIKYKLIKK